MKKYQQNSNFISIMQSLLMLPYENRMDSMQLYNIYYKQIVKSISLKEFWV